LRIALVRARYNPYGGAERFAARAMQALVDQGAEVSILARSWSGAGVPSHTQLVRCDPFYVGSVWRERSFARAVRRQLAREPFDLVQSHERIPGLPIYRAGDGVHAAWLRRRSARMNATQRAGLWLNPFHRYMLATERAMFTHPDLRAVICNAVMVRDEILRYFPIVPDKLHVIPNGIDLKHFTPEVRTRHRAAMRSRFGIQAAQPVVLFLGSGFARKGLAVALKAVAQAERGIHLVVAGADKRAANYQALAVQLGITERVHFVGAVEDPLPFYGMADAFILPTLYDPFPNAVLEALACGLPVITSSACGAREALHNGLDGVHGISGWVAPEGAGAEDYARILRVWVARAGEPGLAAAARAAAEPYSLDALGTALLALYRTLLDTARC